MIYSPITQNYAAAMIYSPITQDYAAAMIYSPNDTIMQQQSLPAFQMMRQRILSRLLVSSNMFEATGENDS